MRALAWGLNAGKLPEKYRTERIDSKMRGEYPESITAPSDQRPPP